ncbi:hypothetical protein niasHT_010724 [Heterodera trifolii]|uniref:Ion transport domain-containing protein n=1 Tax=Heterodera trifolii TaxID=157864 RepID=A0ABD2LJW4_9BILA
MRATPGSIDAEHRKPLSGENAKAQELLDLFNERSLVWEDEEKMIFLFDYVKGAASRGEIINRVVLKTLKDRGQWRVIRHPLVLNFVNEKLLSCALFYVVHILLYFLFLALLFSYVNGPPSVAKNLLVSTILLFFVFFMLVKAALKLQFGIGAVSAWFLISYTWSLITYAITLLYIWSWHLFSFDDYNEELKRTIGWFLPIVATLASWINCLYVLRKAPCGSYILMMSKILFSFLNTTIIWIPTLATFAFAFMLIMRDSGTAPWDDQDFGNTSSVLMALFQSFTKTSAMMIGEVEANDILGRKAWVANFLLILFEIITVILLMNLMVSLAVGDVNELRVNAEERMLRIKVNFCIEALHLSEQISFLNGFVHVLHRSQTNNILVIYKAENIVYSRLMPNIRDKFFGGADGSGTKMMASAPAVRRERVYDVVINSTSGLKLRKEQSTNRATLMSINGCTFHLVESTPGGIRPMESANVTELDTLRDTENLWRKFQRWLIGLNWKALLFA